MRGILVSEQGETEKYGDDGPLSVINAFDRFV